MGAGNTRWLAWASAAFAGLQILLVALAFLRLIGSNTVELRGTARLLSTRFRAHFLIRGALLVTGGMALPLIGAEPAAAADKIVAVFHDQALRGRLPEAAAQAVQRWQAVFDRRVQAAFGRLAQRRPLTEVT